MKRCPECRRDYYDDTLSFAVTAYRPGISTTLQARRANIPFAFILPQNDSQALLSEVYREQIGEEICMAFSSFEKEFSFSRDLVDLRNKKSAVLLAVTYLEVILDKRQDQIKEKIRLLLSSPVVPKTCESFKLRTRSYWSAGDCRTRLKKSYKNELVKPIRPLASDSS